MNTDLLSAALYHGHRIMNDLQPGSQNRCPVRLSAAGHCMRELALKAAGATETPISGETAEVFEDGHSRGERLARALEAAGHSGAFSFAVVDKEAEHWLSLTSPDDEEKWSEDEGPAVVKWFADAFGDTPSAPLPLRWSVEKKRVEVRGRSDARVVWTRNEKPVITTIDFKGANPRSMTFMKKETGLKAAKPYDVAQIACYLVSQKEEGLPDGASVDDGILCYQNKGYGDFLPITVPLVFAEELVNLTIRPNLARVLRYITQLRSDDVPPGYEPDGKGVLPWNCNYCSVADTCWRFHGLVNSGTEQKPKRRVENLEPVLKPKEVGRDPAQALADMRNANDARAK